MDGVGQLASENPDLKFVIEYKPREPRVHMSFDSVARTLLGIEKIGLPNVGILLDFGHALFGGESPADSAQLAIDYGRLFGMDVNDNLRSWDDDMVAGTVHPIELFEFFYTLRKNDWEGVWQLDQFPFREDSVAAADHAIDFLKAAERGLDKLDFQACRRRRTTMTHLRHSHLRNVPCSRASDQSISVGRVPCGGTEPSAHRAPVPADQGRSACTTSKACDSQRSPNDYMFRSHEFPRLLKEAATLGVVRTVVVPPEGVYTTSRKTSATRFGLMDVVVADYSEGSNTSLLAALGAAGAAYLETTLTGGERVGISSWSSTLLATVDSMVPRTVATASEVIQVIGGVGNPVVQVQATRLTDRFSRVTGGVPKFFPAPGIVGSRAARDALLEDPYIHELTEEWRNLTVVLAGVGSLEPSTLLRDSGNAISEQDMDGLRGLGAVGDICLRFFDAEGRMVDTELHDRVLGISSEDLLAVPRKVGIAGGSRKLAAIRGAALGGWIDVLITDLATARRLAST